MNVTQLKRISKLISALRSGQYQPNYEQRLKDENDHYDILGLACHISKLGCWEEVQKSPFDFGICYIIKEESKSGGDDLIVDFDAGNMPKKVVEYYGFRDSKGSYGEVGENFVTYDDLAKDEEEGVNGGHQVFEEDIKDTRGRIRTYRQGAQHNTAITLKIPKFTYAPSLAQLHDTKQMTFKQLANFIERAIKDKKIGLFINNDNDN